MDREQELSELRRELETVMSIVSKDKRSKIERLFVLAEGVTSPLEVISMIEAAVQGVKNELTGSANTSEAPSPVSEREPDSRQPSVPPPPPPPPPQAQQSEQASEPPESFVFVPVPIPEKMKLKDTARYLLLEAGREADAGERELALIRAQEKAYKKLGIEGEDNCGDQLRGIYARSQGKFRAEFVARQLLQFPEGAKRERALKKLARCYGEIPEVLLTEAQAHKSWKKAYGLL